MPATDLEALKAAHPILDVLQRLGVEVQHGRFRCPQPERHAHGDRTPSVTVRAERGSFKCWVCPEVRGDVIDLVKLIRRCGFKEALDFLGAQPPAPAVMAQRRAARQTEMFPALKPSRPAAAAASGGPAAPALETATLPADAEADETLRRRVLAALLELCPPVGGKVARYLQKRRIFKRTWESQRLRMVDDYGAVSDRLAAAFGAAALERAGFFNAAGHLRYYKHRLLFPYFDEERRPVYLQARAIDPESKPKELSMAGPIPLPYNRPLLDGQPGHVYLCEGVIDTLTLLEQGFPAVGVPGAANFKPAWAALFRNKSVHVAFDPDTAGDAGAERAIELLRAGGVEASRFKPPKGLDLNDWFRKG